MSRLPALPPLAIAAVFWLGALLYLGDRWRHQPQDGRSGLGRQPPWRSLPCMLGIVSLLFLTYTVFAGVLQDYYLYVQIWREVRLGHDPWFLVMGVFGNYPLNAYGPLFNLLAVPAWLSPLLPKLLFATSYVLFAFCMTMRASGRGQSLPVAMLMLLAWFWNPYVWVELAHYGHFDVLAGLACVAALESRGHGRDLQSGLWLGLGVLLKYMPVVLLPFLVLDGKRIRWKLLAATVLVVTLGFGGGVVLWGPSTFRPFLFAATRAPQHLSIYRFLNGLYSPLHFVRAYYAGFLDQWAPLILMLALLRTWSWHRERNVATEPAAVIAMFVTVLFYQVGFAQYQIVPFMLVSWWLATREPARPQGRLLAMTLVAYFGWLSTFDVIGCLVDIDGIRMQEWVGLLTFILGIGVLACLVAAARPRREIDPEPANRADATA
jgi:hypothetical protein